MPFPKGGSVFRRNICVVAGSVQGGMEFVVNQHGADWIRHKDHFAGRTSDSIRYIIITDEDRERVVGLEFDALLVSPCYTDLVKFCSTRVRLRSDKEDLIGE